MDSFSFSLTFWHHFSSEEMNLKNALNGWIANGSARKLERVTTLCESFFNTYLLKLGKNRLIVNFQFHAKGIFSPVVWNIALKNWPENLIIFWINRLLVMSLPSEMTMIYAVHTKGLAKLKAPPFYFSLLITAEFHQWIWKEKSSNTKTTLQVLKPQKISCEIPIQFS